MQSDAEKSQTSSPFPQAEVIDFGNIAISFSGGGYRAAAFHLGSLDILHRLGLLDKVTMLSTVSGGTVTGAKYVLSLSRKDPKTDQNTFFNNFYSELYTFLLQERLPDIWLQNLNKQRQTQEIPSLIVAAAETYNSKLFNNAQFKEIIETKPRLHLKEIIFNTAELRTGTNFRFRVGIGGLIGNGNISIPESVLKEIRVADVVAASSCFPIGFEPINFPHDFRWSNGWESVLNNISDKQKLKSLSEALNNPLPLIDGGIYDNLGVEAIWLADKRARNQHPIGTLIISDTDNLGIEETLIKKLKPNLPNWLTKITLKQVKNAVRTLFLVFLFSTAMCIFYMIAWVRSFTLVNVLIAWATIVFAVLAIIFKKISDLFKRLSSRPIILDGSQQENSGGRKNILSFLQDIIIDWDAFFQTIGDVTINEAYNLLTIRLQTISAVLLAFLKGQRRRNYNKAFEDYGINVIDNFIFKTKKKLEEPFPVMAEIALKATQTPTTLWFDANPEKAKEQLDTIIACGQLTMCYKILEHINRRLSKKNGIIISSQMQEVHEKSLDAWNKLQENPYSLVRDRSS